MDITIMWHIFSYCLYFFYWSIETHNVKWVKRRGYSDCQSSWCMKCKILHVMKRCGKKYGYYYHLSYFQLLLILFLLISKNSQCKLGKKTQRFSLSILTMQEMQIWIICHIFSDCSYFFYWSIETHNVKWVKRRGYSHCQFSRCMKCKNYF